MLKIQYYTSKIYSSIKFKKSLQIYKHLKKSQSLPFEELEDIQFQKLKKLLIHAYQNVPYYKNVLIEAGIMQNGKIKLSSIEEFEKIPFMTKEIIRHEKSKLYSLDINTRKSHKNTSGGSTGEPVVFMQDRNFSTMGTANFYLVRSWRGADPFDSTISLWGAERDTFEGKKPLKARLSDFIYNINHLNTFILSSNTMNEYIRTLNIEKPKLIIAYAQSIFEIAKYAKANNIYVEKQQAIHSAAGTLYAFMREMIEDVFQCKVFNYYGSREVGTIASECQAHDGLHIMMDHTLVEIVNKNGYLCKPGEEGEIVVTTLNNYSMPLIRYKIGDVGIMQEYEECSCGCTYPKLKKVIGRSTDIFKSKEGKKIDGEYFTHLFYFIDGVKTFQVIQEELEKIVLKIVKNGEIDHADLEEIEKKIKIVMGEECEIIFKFVEDIPKTRTGKMMYTISKVK